MLIFLYLNLLLCYHFTLIMIMAILLSLKEKIEILLSEILISILNFKRVNLIIFSVELS